MPVMSGLDRLDSSSVDDGAWESIGRGGIFQEHDDMRVPELGSRNWFRDTAIRLSGG